MIDNHLLVFQSTNIQTHLSIVNKVELDQASTKSRHIDNFWVKDMKHKCQLIGNQ
jgi:hypothetical protein